MDLSEFLLARISEDEECAHRLLAPYAWGWSSFHEASPDELEHIARHDPARVLADCAAVRAVVHQSWSAMGDPWTYDMMARYLAEDALLEFARVWAAHPDFDPAWR